VNCRGQRPRLIANDIVLFIVTGSMRSRAAMVIIASALASVPFAFGGTDHGASSSSGVIEEPPRFDFAIESAYLFGAFNPPRNYEISANFLTARMRWGNYLNREGLFRGYNQVYFSFLAEPIIRGIENHYFGMNLGLRYNFVRPGSRLVPYFSSGVGLGAIDSQPEQFGGQGQDFTFNILSALGVSYQFSNRFSGQVGVLYQHFSNAGLTDPNPSLNLFGPQIGFSFSF
jgi:Lipid A 3-O-deacylase (PagL)